MDGYVYNNVFSVNYTRTSCQLSFEAVWSIVLIKDMIITKCVYFHFNATVLNVRVFLPCKHEALPIYILHCGVFHLEHRFRYIIQQTFHDFSVITFGTVTCFHSNASLGTKPLLTLGSLVYRPLNIKVI